MRKGFTLLEMLLALTIFSIVMISSTSIFLLGTQIWKRTQGRYAIEQKAALAVEKLAKDIRCMMKAENPSLQGEGADHVLKIPSLIHALDQQGFAAVQPGRVIYKLGYSSKEICRAEESVSDIYRNREPDCRPIAQHIKSLKFRYWVYSGIGNSFTWYDRWDAKDGNPQAIEIRLELEDKLPGENAAYRTEYKKTVLVPIGGKPEVSTLCRMLRWPLPKTMNGLPSIL